MAVLVGLTGSTPAASAASAAPSAAAAASKAPAGLARVTGQARVFYAYSPHDDIRFSVDAKAAPFSRPVDGLPQGMPTDARGTVTISHWSPGKQQGRRAEAAVDCLVTGGDTATLSAVVTKSEDADEIGERLGFSVTSGGPGKGRFGFSWAVSNVDVVEGKAAFPHVGTCMAPAPFAAVTKGGFKVRHAALPPLPTGWGKRADGVGAR
ncbi:hypothetical protein [Streptomyces platensis]|uniref:hypothetical protein n=1 Tax=Streptomyces platensis TaxID=58346 RepID=UPI001F4665D3|nr:hypothetical protein [Streptomyces platensis]MCF3147859.1 hypothetical protein [Streptomyces platensis]